MSALEYVRAVKHKLINTRPWADGDLARTMEAFSQQKSVDDTVAMLLRRRIT